MRACVKKRVKGYARERIERERKPINFEKFYFESQIFVQPEAIYKVFDNYYAYI